LADQNIVTNITATANFSSLTAQLQAVTSQLLKLQATTIGLNKNLTSQVGVMNRQFDETMRSTGQFARHFVTLTSDVSKFGQNLDSGRMKLGQYFRTWQGHTQKTSSLVRDLAKQQVMLENAVIQPLGKNAQGLMQYNVMVQSGLDVTKNKSALLRQELAIMNKVMMDGSNQLINWGKNTQWAGRQLTVGLTVPLAAFGMAAAKAFREADQELVRLTKVYGGLTATSSADLLQVRKDVIAVSRELASGLGANFKETIGIAADIAATGKQGAELIDSTRQTTRLAILGEVDRQDAMKATLAIQTAFGQNTMELAESIDFLNAVENQTSTTLEDLVTAIPKAGPVVKALGGDVQDLALYLTAMREGGINASEGANALKSALASVINPTKVAKEMFMGLGIDLSGIVDKNAGNLTGTIMALKDSLDSLEPLQRARAIEQLFGKFQFARINALFENLGKQGSQTLQVLDLMKASTQDLASISERELNALTESASGKYRRALESVKAELAVVGEQFLKVGAFVLNAIDGILKFIGNLPGPIKAVLGFIGGLTAIAGPIIMLTGVLANFFGYIIKGVLALKNIGKGGTGFKLLTPELMAASAAAKTVEQSFYSDTKAAATFSDAVMTLAASFERLKQSAMSSTIATSNSMSTVAGNPVMGIGGRIVDKDNPLVGRPFSRDMSHMNSTASKTPEERANETIFSTVPGPKPVNLRLSNSPQTYMHEDLPRIHGVTSVNGVSNGVVASEAAKWHSMTAAIAMQSKAELAILKTEVAATGTITASLADSYQALLPQMTKITSMAADETALIVQQLQASKITVEAARAKIFALNAQVEAMMVQTAQAVAAAQSRTISLTTVPLTSQPVVSAAGKSNMKELFHKTETAKMVDAIARGLGVRTSGAGYSIHTTKPRFNTGGKIESFGPNKTQVTGPASVSYDDRLGSVPVGGYVLNQQASMDPRNAALVAAAPSTYDNSGSNITALLTPKETVFGPGIQNNPELFRAVDAANNGNPIPGHMAGGKINFSRSSYGVSAIALRKMFGTSKKSYRSAIDDLVENKNLQRAGLRERDMQFLGKYGRHKWVTRGPSTRAVIDDYIQSLPPAQRKKAAEVIEEFSASLKTGRGGAASGAARDPFTIESGHLQKDGPIDQALRKAELPLLDLANKIHATHLTRGITRDGKRFVSKYTADYDAVSNLQANHGTLLAKNFLERNMYRTGKYDTLMRRAGVEKSKWADTEKEIDAKITSSLLGKEGKRIGDEKGDITFDSFIPLIDSSIIAAGGSAAKLNSLKANVVERKNKGGMIGGRIKRGLYNYGRLFLGMPRSIKQVEKQRQARLTMEEIDAGVRTGKYSTMPPTNFGKLDTPTTGHSFPVDGIGGVYIKPDGSKVFVKPVMDEDAALSQQRATMIARGGHDMHSPTQEIRTMIDPTDPAGRRKLIVLESPYDKAFATQTGVFDEKAYFKQLVAANLRGDKDLSRDNISGRNLNDTGTDGVYDRASGKRRFHGEWKDGEWIDKMPSMQEMARINLLGVKGGAKKFFAEATLNIPKGMTPQQYHQKMIDEIDEVLPKLKETIAKFGDLNPTEAAVYAAMIKRLEDGRRVNWEEFHGIHSAVKVSPPKALTPAALKKLKDEAELRIRQRGHAISLSDNSFKTPLNGFNGGGIINVLKSLAMRRIGAGFGPTGAPKPSMYESAPWGVSSLSIKAAETLFASTGLRPYSQKLLYDKFAAALAKEKPYGYVKGADGSLRNALEPSSLDAVIRKAASDLMSDRAAFKQLSPIDRDILKRKYLNWDSKKDTPITGEIKKKIFGIDGEREMGGPVSPGQSYLVGEKGPEIFSPLQSGNIIPQFALGGLIKRSKDFYGEKITDVSQVASKEHAKRLLRSGDPSQRAIGQLYLNNLAASRTPMPVVGTPPKPGPLSVGTTTIIGNGGVRTNVPTIQGSLPYVTSVPLQRANQAIDSAIGSIASRLKISSDKLVVRARMMGSEINSSMMALTGSIQKLGTSIKTTSIAASTSIASTVRSFTSTYSPGGSQILAYGVPGSLAAGVGQSYGPAAFGKDSDVSKAKRAGTAFSTNAKYTTAAMMHPLQFLKSKGIGADPDRPLGAGAGGMLVGTMGGMAAGGAIGKAVGGENGVMMGSMIGMMAGPAIMQGAGKLVTSMAGKAVAAGAVKAGLAATAAGVAGLVAPLLAVTAAGYGAYKMWGHYKRGQELNIQSFGLTAESAKKANLRFTDFGSKIKDTIQDSKDMADANKLVYESMKDGGTPFQMTIAEYKKLKKEVKETFAEQIAVLDRQPSEKVPDAVRRIKESLIAAGMSADEATKKVFTMLQLSNKKDQSITATIGNAKFKNITDPQSAAVSAVTSFGTDTRDQGSKERAMSLNTALMATETGINDLIAKRERLVAKDLTGKTKSLTYAEAEKIMIDKINKSKEAGTAITMATVYEMAKTNPEVLKMINGSDTVVSVWQKIRLQAQGFTGDLSQLNAAQTKLIADSFAAISDAVVAKNRVGILKEQYDSLDKLEGQIKRYTKALKGQSVAEQISDRDRLKSLNKQIEAINKLAESRKKALAAAQEDANLGRQIEKVRLEIQNAEAVGDTEKAQSLRIDLESLTSQQQTDAQMKAIDTAAEAATKPLKAAADAISNKQEKLGDAASIAAESLDKLKDRYDKQQAAIKKVNDSMTALYGNAAAAGLTVEAYAKKNKEASAGFVAAMQAATGAAMPKYKERTYYNGSMLVTEKVPIAPYENALELLAKSGAATGVNAALIKALGDGATLKDVVDAVKGINGKPALRENIKVTGDYSDSKETKEVDGKKVQVLNAQARDAIRKRLDLQPGETFIVDGQKYKQNTTGGTPIWMGAAPKVPALHEGGKISGPGTATSDSIPAMLSDGEYVFSAKAVDAAGGPDAVDSLHKALRRAEGGPIGKQKPQKQQLPFFPWRPDLPDYWSNGKPTGDPRTGRWGELRYGPSKGKDIWGGTEIPGLKFTGKTPQQSDYWHQMTEQPSKFRGPGMGIDKDPMRYAGSGASMGFSGNGAYGFGPLLFHKGGPVGHRHGRNLPSSFENSILNKLPISSTSTATMSSPATGLAGDAKFNIDSEESSAFLSQLKDMFNIVTKPFTPSNSPDISQQSSWSKKYRNFIKKYVEPSEQLAYKMNPIQGWLLQPLRQSRDNIYAGDGKWNDFTSIGASLVGTGVYSKVPLSIDALSAVQKTAKIKSFIKGPASLSPYESALIKAEDLARAGNFTPISKLGSAKYKDILEEAKRLTEKTGSIPTAKGEYSFKFTPAPLDMYPAESTFKQGISAIQQSPYSASEWVGPAHKLEIFGPDGKTAGHLSWDSITGTIKMIGVNPEHQKLGLARFMNQYASSLTRLKHSRNRTTQGHGYSSAIGGIMPDKPFISPGKVSIGTVLTEAVGVKLPSILPKLKGKKLAPEPTSVPEYAGPTLNTGNSADDAARAKLSAAQRAREAEQETAHFNALMAWRKNPNRTYSSYPFVNGSYLESIDEADLLRLMNIGQDTPATWSWTNPLLPPLSARPPARPNIGTRDGMITGATGGYVIGGKLNVPKFKNGINVVPQDMLAMIHKNESIIPATMNPFNPEAAMPKYNFNRSSFNVRGDGAIGASYTVNQNIYASEGMDVEALSNMIVKKAEVVIGQKAKVNVKMVGQGKNI